MITLRAAAAVAILAALPVASGGAPLPQLKPAQPVLEEAPAWSLAAEHRLCLPLQKGAMPKMRSLAELLAFLADDDMSKCLSFFDMMVEIGAE